MLLVGRVRMHTIERLDRWGYGHTATTFRKGVALLELAGGASDMERWVKQMPEQTDGPGAQEIIEKSMFIQLIGIAEIKGCRYSAELMKIERSVSTDRSGYVEEEKDQISVLDSVITVPSVRSVPGMSSKSGVSPRLLKHSLQCIVSHH